MEDKKLMPGDKGYIPSEWYHCDKCGEFYDVNLPVCNFCDGKGEGDPGILVSYTKVSRDDYGNAVMETEQKHLFIGDNDGDSS